MAKKQELNTAVKATFKDGSTKNFQTIEEASLETGISIAAIKIRCNKPGTCGKDKTFFEWVDEHTAEEIAEVIQDFFPDTDLDLLATAIQSYKDIDAWNDTPVLKQESFDKLQEVMSLAGELTKKAPYDKIVNNKYAEEAIK